MISDVRGEKRDSLLLFILLCLAVWLYFGKSSSLLRPICAIVHQRKKGHDWWSTAQSSHDWNSLSASKQNQTVKLCGHLLSIQRFRQHSGCIRHEENISKLYCVVMQKTSELWCFVMMPLRYEGSNLQHYHPHVQPPNAPRFQQFQPSSLFNVWAKWQCDRCVHCDASYCYIVLCLMVTIL